MISLSFGNATYQLLLFIFKMVVMCLVEDVRNKIIN